MDELKCQGPSYSTMCSHQITTFLADPDRYVPASDKDDANFRAYLADSGAATGIIKALVELLEDGPSGSGSAGAQLLADSLSGWCVPKATNGGLVRGELVENEDELLSENEQLRARLDELTTQFEETKAKLSAAIPSSELTLTSITATGVSLPPAQRRVMPCCTQHRCSAPIPCAPRPRAGAVR